MKEATYTDRRLIKAIFGQMKEPNANGERFCTEELIGNTLVTVCGRYWTESYQEDDWYSGTGAWITTDAAVRIESVEAVGPDGEAVELDTDGNGFIEKAVEKQLTMVYDYDGRTF